MYKWKTSWIYRSDAFILVERNYPATAKDKVKLNNLNIPGANTWIGVLYTSVALFKKSIILSFSAPGSKSITPAMGNASHRPVCTILILKIN